MAVRSKDLSQAEKEIFVCQAEQIHKIFTQNSLRLLFCVKIVVILLNLHRLTSVIKLDWLTSQFVGYFASIYAEAISNMIIKSVCLVDCNFNHKKDFDRPGSVV